MIRKRDNDENRLQNEPVDQNFTSPCGQSSAATERHGEGSGVDMPEAMVGSVHSVWGAGAGGQ